MDLCCRLLRPSANIPSVQRSRSSLGRTPSFTAPRLRTSISTPNLPTNITPTKIP